MKRPQTHFLNLGGMHPVASSPPPPWGPIENMCVFALHMCVFSLGVFMQVEYAVFFMHTFAFS